MNPHDFYIELSEKMLPLLIQRVNPISSFFWPAIATLENKSKSPTPTATLVSYPARSMGVYYAIQKQGGVQSYSLVCCSSFTTIYSGVVLFSNSGLKG